MRENKLRIVRNPDLFLFLVTAALYKYAIRTYIQFMNKVVLNKKAQKQFKKMPTHIQGKLQSWIESVEAFGIKEIRIIPGYHDEPLTGQKIGQRSIRLSRAYRAFYVEYDDKIMIEIIEVNKHDY